ncbi:hypothetical protein M422DRAFT_215237 [Sphaerobolus stellatus SS14]|uniref:Cytochrome P450 n=1 Tax=Sphaerobolus stellatus (strain SS14) TaxID=990650 RepID=A0A0C9UUC6_SPHS4|nr:hypothetical protein M422DRAFT_215237 [Sphaerobolus stellatus SS14]
MMAWTANNLVFGVGLATLLYYVQRTIFRRQTTKLPGPPAQSWLFGLSQLFFEADDIAVLQEEWVRKYGPVLDLPGFFGARRVLLCDPKAAAHFYARETTTYRMEAFSKRFVELLFGKGLLSADGHNHKRQRKALTPGFSNQAIRALTGIFYDSFYKLKTNWDTIIEGAAGEALIDVQGWMNKVALDTIGVAGFSHDFGTLQGQHSVVAETFDSFTRVQNKPPSYRSLIMSLFVPVLPFLLKLPGNPRLRSVKKLHKATGEVADDLLKRMRDEKAAKSSKEKGPRSLIETLILAEGANSSQISLTQEEVSAQMKTLILAGYETTSVILTWALISLAMNKDIQDALRAEISEINGDPTYEQLLTGLPLLDAVMKETLRLNPPVGGTQRLAFEDDIIPLSQPIKTADGQMTDSIFVAAGTLVQVPIRYMNRSTILWGEDAREFKPSRWLSAEAGIPDKAKEVHGFAHILTFSDGPRICLGRQFATVEFKAVFSRLIRNYEFSLPDGKDTKLEKVLGILPRPRVAGQEGSRVPMLIKRVE